MDADVALYEAKAGGRNRAVRFEPHMRGAFRTRIELERDLRMALERHEFFVVYQPVVQLDSDAIRSFEALLRWRRPTGQVVTPDVFIPVLEDSGLIVEVGAYVLQAACHQVRLWQDQGLATAVSVNVSPLQFETPTFVGTVQQTLEHEGLDAASLILEMTETTLMRNSDEASRRLSALKSLGVRLAIDDFGTGYSSLAYLQQFPMDILKIDRTFVAASTDAGPSAALLHALVESATPSVSRPWPRASRRWLSSPGSSARAVTPDRGSCSASPSSLPRRRRSWPPTPPTTCAVRWSRGSARSPGPPMNRTPSAQAGPGAGLRRCAPHRRSVLA